MNGKFKAPWISAAARRVIVVVILIAVITPLWTYLLFLTETPMIVMAGFALIVVLLFSTGTAWAASAIPPRESKREDRSD
ncbi:MAG: hypothetical protein V2J20_12495 [Wenzhouxiangella sp.]|jgi:hypothetical protein|nr:hypothetical protein [Wenzhouxiangella sp.]